RGGRGSWIRVIVGSTAGCGGGCVAAVGVGETAAGRGDRIGAAEGEGACRCGSSAASAAGAIGEMSSGDLCGSCNTPASCQLASDCIKSRCKRAAGGVSSDMCHGRW